MEKIMLNGTMASKNRDKSVTTRRIKPQQEDVTPWDYVFINQNGAEAGI